MHRLGVPTFLAALLLSAQALCEPQSRSPVSWPAAPNASDREKTIWVELAERGDRKAQTHLGLLYLSGLWVEQSDSEAARWLKAAAVQSDPDAQYYLGDLYLTGRGVRQNPQAAYFWCELSIRLGVTQTLQPAFACSEQAARAITREAVSALRQGVFRWEASRPLVPEAAGDPKS